MLDGLLEGVTLHVLDDADRAALAVRDVQQRVPVLADPEDRFELSGVDREVTSGLASAVDDDRQATGTAELAGSALAELAARGRVEGDGFHDCS